MKIQEVLEYKKHGLYYGNRILLPFKAHILKVILDDKIYTDFSQNGKQVSADYHEFFMDLYFNDYDDLKEVVSRHEAIKMVAVNFGEDVFNLNNHRKLVLYLKEKHVVEIEATDEDIIFIE